MIGSNQIPLVPDFPNLIRPKEERKPGDLVRLHPNSADPFSTGLIKSTLHCALHDTEAGMHDLRQASGRGLPPRPDIAGPGGYPPSTAMAVVVPFGCGWSILPIP